MKTTIKIIATLILLLSVKTAFATEVLCECNTEKCEPVSFELAFETEGKVYMKAEFVNSSIEGYAIVRKSSKRNIYNLDSIFLIEDFKKGFDFLSSNRTCEVIKN